ncbi:MAG: SpoIIE family protein phosphatase [Candidatus Promineifilaceae bacterium]|jgi:sigma-B regulation protein RsbU (phosphoserine phosphatase)
MLTDQQKKDVIQHVQLFANTLEEKLLEIVPKLNVFSYQSGDLVYEKGDIGDTLFIVASGKLRVNDGSRTLNYLGPRAVFGELAAVNPVVRNTTVTAIEDSQVLGLSHEMFTQLAQNNPDIAYSAIQILSSRLRARIDDLSDLRKHLEEVTLPLGVAMSEQEELDSLLDLILAEALKFCNADAGTIYLRTGDDKLEFANMRTESLGINLGGVSGSTIPFEPLPIFDAVTGEPNERNIATYVAYHGQPANIPDIYDAHDFDFTATKEFDLKNNYRSMSAFTTPLKDHLNNVVGVLQLLNAQDNETGEIIPFNIYQQLLVQSLASQASTALNTRMLLERQKQLLKYELDLQTGRQIQADFLPDDLPQPDGWEVAARFKPAREVAGDFYDAFTMSQKRRVGFVIADVVDKGVPAALFMALCRSLTRAFAQQHYSLSWTDVLENDSPTKPSIDRRRRRPREMTGTIALKNAVTLTNKYILDNHLDLNMFATLFFGLFNPRNGQLAYINAGHNPPFIFSAEGELKAALKPSGPAVGMFPGVEFNIEFAEFEPGDILFAYTDGVTEARAKNKEFFTEKRLLELLARPLPSAEATVDLVYNRIHEFMEGAVQADDITMMAVHRKKLSN